jgi:hypothetical protein
MNIRQSVFAALVSASFLAACGSGDQPAPASSGSATKTAEPAKSAGPSAAKSAAPAASSAAPAASAPAADAPKVEMEDKDLGKVAALKGWTAKGPKDADVMEDLGGARIVTKKVSGPGSFDLAFKIGKTNLKELKTNLQKGAEAAKAKITFTVDTADALEWTNEIGSTKDYSFSIISKVGGKDVTCYTVTPRESEADVNALKEACKTLAKK